MLGTPLVKKLGIKDDFRITTVNAPQYYADLIADAPSTIELIQLEDGQLDFIHAFYLLADDLQADFARLKDALKPDGMLWISWAKKASKIETDITREIVREMGLAGGLVDVKVSSIDATWSGLKFVYRLEDR